MMDKVQRFGGAMITPVLLFAFFGIIVGVCTFLQQEAVLGPMAAEGTTWWQCVNVVKEGGWTVFREINLLFVIGLPIGLAKKQSGRACMEAFVLYMVFNYMLSAMLAYWGINFGVDFSQEVINGSGLAQIAGIKTLDTSMIGALLISGIAIYLHNKYFDTRLPEWLGTFSGSPLVIAIGFFLMIPVAFITMVVWPIIQSGIEGLQGFITQSGVLGLGVFIFLERLLIPTGLHHLLAKPIEFSNIVVDGGLQIMWIDKMPEIAASTKKLTELFPYGFLMYGNSKVFAPIGIAGAFYATAKKSKRQEILGLMIPVTITAILAGITEPIEFTFLFSSPVLFVIHAVLAALLSVTMFLFGITGLFTGGIIDFISYNWLPLAANHWQAYLLQIAIGLIFSLIWFIVFRFVILRMNLNTPGREADDEEAKLINKQEYKELKSNENNEGSYSEDTSNDPTGSKDVAGGVPAKAEGYLEALGGKENISGVTNCFTRLRVDVKDGSLVQSEAVFKKYGAYGLMKKGNNVQIIDGTNVQFTRDEFEKLL
ncbi:MULTISPECIES: alpha-glucoside-specific PTS transporter subunit IIBC [Aerococcus]|uniref:alpha-glucoside-specific PTS transporter subunit IIBC n=1 Tax=Aerococcus TaxID=1375 RepID=UPI000DCE8F0C|nr:MULTISPECIES: alpha-glucoside-specific PTS transporter subunit IIBC [Aerococcus]KAA9295467.1 PTS alpha-glucoside transporter subunit IIBC [Aerococcus tenax]MDK6688145.1 alpha-glucoside-specific PTS transporter subunit IIBC [Aerococcus urinae]MDK8132735.1 alpha-glucoside-specific PTS transporter subunit IIBC [Aerococcus urinae]MDK8484345.1 alpha-glucoside-specific PTS transporter subunit IIBC [Aerococcus urinae]MDL5179373.1 alpha-glucoside-specific PTS transporter subunit IIBC [Aerococcus te